MDRAKQFIKTGAMPLLILAVLINSFFFPYRVQNAMLQEKLVEKTEAINGLAVAIEANPNSNGESIIQFVEYYDRLFQVFGAAYKANGDDLPTLITSREFETSIFEPLDYSIFKDAIYSNDDGTVIIRYKPENQSSRDLHLYFRWIPLNAPHEERYLIVLGVSKHSIVTDITTRAVLEMLTLTVLLAYTTARLWGTNKRRKRK